LPARPMCWPTISLAGGQGRAVGDRSADPVCQKCTPSSMEELADRVGELKAAKSDLDAYLERLKALFVASGRDEAEGALFRVVLGAASVATTVDRKAIEAAMGERWLARFLKFGKPSRSFRSSAGRSIG
jgi:hypothetical protein